MASFWNVLSRSTANTHCLSPSSVESPKAADAPKGWGHSLTPCQHTASRGLLPIQLLQGHSLPAEQGACCAAAQPDLDILTAVLCVSEAQFLSGEEKQASPLPQRGITDCPGQGRRPLEGPRLQRACLEQGGMQELLVPTPPLTRVCSLTCP